MRRIGAELEVLGAGDAAKDKKLPEKVAWVQHPIYGKGRLLAGEICGQHAYVEFETLTGQTSVRDLGSAGEGELSR